MNLVIVSLFTRLVNKNHPEGDKKREAKKRPKDTQLERPKKREKVSFYCGRKLFHPWPFLCH